MWKRTMWKHILLEYVDITCVVENVQPQKKKKSVEKNSHNNKYKVNRKRINGLQQKQTKQKNPKETERI